jgi:hypothetical protein
MLETIKEKKTERVDWEDHSLRLARQKVSEVSQAKS